MAEPSGVRPFFVSSQNRGLNAITETRIESSGSYRVWAGDSSLPTSATIHLVSCFISNPSL
jgi:hypothetical protein